jgi:flavin-dependent dehydrogenase
LVVGGGPVGLATSIFAAQRGMRVTVVERGTLPKDKPCGEGLMPEGVRLLASMGVTVRRSVPLHGIRYVDDTVGAVEACFTSGNGLGVRRRELSSALVERAQALGVRLCERATVVGMRTEHGGVAVDLGGRSLEASFLAAADGLHSRMRARAGLEARSRGSRRKRYGFRRHYRMRPWSRFVEVHWARGAEAYVTPVGDDEVGIALLWHEPAPSFEAMLRRFPVLAARLRGAPATTPVKGAGPFRRGARRVHQGRLALVGDAAGYVDAITGDGVALGFRSARELVGAIESGRGLAFYERAFRRLRRRHVIMTEAALLMATYPRLRRRVIGALARRPTIFGRLVAANAAE